MSEYTDIKLANARIAELEAQLAAPAKPKAPDAREQSILKRMQQGRISREAATMAVDHQADNDKRMADAKKKAAAAAK